MKRYPFGRGPRAVAAYVAYVVNTGDQRVKDLLEQVLERSDFDRRDRDLATELAYGMVRRRGTLDCVVDCFSRLGRKKIQPRVLEILRLGVYQLVFLDKVPASAAVNEAVRIAKRVASKGAVGFVNACLRAVARTIRGTAEAPGPDPRRAVPLGGGAYRCFARPVLPDPGKSLAAYLAAAWSHPQWMVRRWLRRYGEDETRAVCRAGCASPDIVLRVNRRRAAQDDLVAEVVAEGRWARPLGADHVALRRGGDLAELVPLREGRCTVQGVAASAAAPLVAPKPGELVLEVCCAPGSKACQLDELADGRATVVGVDISPRRLARARENARRLGAEALWLVAGDGCSCERLFAADFDAVLVDAPCSNTGVLARRVESRWRLDEARIRQFAQLQARLLASAAQVVRPGGRLVYSTCSLEPEENEQQIERFCGGASSYRVVKSIVYLPSDTGDDGGYVALLERSDRF
ncbi:MAG: transcription antitermination factor NusB [Candidatus Brocadiia bacterium]